MSFTAKQKTAKRRELTETFVVTYKRPPRASEKLLIKISVERALGGSKWQWLKGEEGESVLKWEKRSA